MSCDFLPGKLLHSYTRTRSRAGCASASLRHRSSGPTPTPISFATSLSRALSGGSKVANLPILKFLSVRIGHPSGRWPSSLCSMMCGSKACGTTCCRFSPTTTTPTAPLTVARRTPIQRPTAYRSDRSAMARLRNSARVVWPRGAHLAIPLLTDWSLWRALANRRACLFRALFSTTLLARRSSRFVRPLFNFNSCTRSRQ